MDIDRIIDLEDLTTGLKTEVDDTKEDVEDLATAIADIKEELEAIRTVLGDTFKRACSQVAREMGMKGISELVETLAFNEIASRFEDEEEQK